MTTRRQQMQCACLDVAVPITRPTIRFSLLAELWPVLLILSLVVALLVQTATAQLLPAITGITPSSGTAGSSLPATITGTDLDGATAVAFSGSGVTATIGTGGTASSLPITITIAAGAATDTRTFAVTTPAGTSPAFSGFTVTSGGPIITGITPSSGAAGTSLGATISGSNLGGATAVSFSGSGVTATIGTGGTASSLPITITIAAGAATGTRTVSIATAGGSSNTFTGFTVTPLSASSAIKVNRNGLYFNTAVIGGNAVNQSLAISNFGSGSLNWNAMANSTGNWLSVAPDSGTAGGMLTVSAAPGSLALGTYTGTITITASGVLNSPVVVPVVFRIGPTITGPYTISTIAGVNTIVEGGAASAQP